MNYVPAESPKEWYRNSELTIVPDRLAFYEDACVVESVQAKRGSISVPIKGIAGSGPEVFDLPRERKPVEYLAIKCAHSLIAAINGQGKMNDRGIKLTWYIIVRSPTEIDMPFLGGSFIKLRKSASTS